MDTDDDITSLLPDYLATANEDSFLCHIVTVLSDLELPANISNELRDSSFTPEHKLRLQEWLWDRQSECLAAIVATVEARIGVIRAASNAAKAA